MVLELLSRLRHAPERLRRLRSPGRRGDRRHPPLGLAFGLALAVRPARSAKAPRGFGGRRRLIPPRRGSPRAYRAWPLAWPSPSGPLGWQRLRRSMVGPEDRFCEAGRNDLRVPLTLEGPARTMRGPPAGCDILTTPGASGAASSAWPWCWRARQRDTAGTAGGRSPGVPCGAADAPGGLPPKGRGGKLPPRNGETPRLNHGRLRRVTVAALSRRLLAPVLAVHGRGRQGPARRRCALEAVRIVVTAGKARKLGRFKGSAQKASVSRENSR
jgi:hypothetical protein